jgi:hypothetical protein
VINMKQTLALLFAVLLASVGYAVAQGPGPVPTFITCGTGLTCTPTNPINGIGTIAQTSPGVTSVNTGSCVNGGPITTSGTIVGAAGVDSRTTTSEAITNADQCMLVTFNNSSPVAATIPQAGVGGLFNSLWSASLLNIGTGTVTLTPATSTINGQATLVLLGGQGCTVFSDGSNYWAQCGQAPPGNQFIQTLSPNNLNTITFTGFPAFNSYDIHINNLQTGIGGGHALVLQFNNDSGSNYSYFANVGQASDTDPWVYSNGSDTSITLLDGINGTGSPPDRPISGWIHIGGAQQISPAANPASGVSWMTSSFEFNSGSEVHNSGTGTYNSSAAITSISLTYQGMAGHVSLWGNPNE